MNVLKENNLTELTSNDLQVTNNYKNSIGLIQLSFYNLF